MPGLGSLRETGIDHPTEFDPKVPTEVPSFRPAEEAEAPEIRPGVRIIRPSRETFPEPKIGRDLKQPAAPGLVPETAIDAPREFDLDVPIEVRPEIPVEVDVDTPVEAQPEIPIEVDTEIPREVPDLRP
jgi:hypothetical protein